MKNVLKSNSNMVGFKERSFSQGPLRWAGSVLFFFGFVSLGVTQEQGPGEQAILSAIDSVRDCLERPQPECSQVDVRSALESAQGNSGAQLHLAMAYLAGIGGSVNRETGMAVLKRQAESNNPEAMYFYAYKLSRQGQTKQSIELLEASANLGSPDSQLLLGLLYLEGKGVDKHVFKAQKFLKQAAESGRPIADYWLGLMYLSGNGVRESESIGVMHLRNAAEHGVTLAQFELGRIGAEHYYDWNSSGKLDPSQDVNDVKAARDMLILAQKSGISVAAYSLAKIYIEQYERLDWRRPEPGNCPPSICAVSDSLAEAQSLAEYWIRQLRNSGDPSLVEKSAGLRRVLDYRLSTARAEERKRNPPEVTDFLIGLAAVAIVTNAFGAIANPDAYQTDSNGKDPTLPSWCHNSWQAGCNPMEDLIY